MQNLDIMVIEHAINWIKTQPVWLCTVLNTFGSSPRPPGTMMSINMAGQFCGSLSGGCIEEDFIRRIQEGEFRHASQVVRYGEGGLPPDRTLPCGGVLDILIEYLPVASHYTNRLVELHQALLGRFSLRKVVATPFSCESLEKAEWRSSTVVERHDEKIVLTIAAAPRVIIAGLSEVAICCMEFAVGLGFETIICETRDDILDNFRHRIHRQAILKNVFPARYLELNGCHANTAIVALTHDPRIDDLTLMEAVNTPAFYLGVMGSERNSNTRLRRLAEIGGLTSQQLERVHAPIGINIGSKTPAEIALSVMCHIVKEKNHIP
ncbi:XdhC family protein [Sodalis sp. RH20]|uniref:XdhC family protein n=1 Tax=unclassified Sodalis (in: enterobacteria) TaxID=2636512 RepID=UPI0039B3C19F